MSDPITTAFSRSAVRLLADPMSFARGLAYAAEGRVEQVTAAETRLAATVRGSLPYEVELWVDGGEPGWSCTCPVGEEGEFCKHCVATALAEATDPLEPETLTEADPEQEHEPEHERDGEHTDDAASLHDYVVGLEHERLAALVLQQASVDWRLAERLRAEAAAAAGSPIDLKAWRRRLESAFATGDFVEYAEAATWAHDVDLTLDALDDLAAAGHPDAVVALTEHALRLAEEAIGAVDDSDGWLTGIAERLGELHLQACGQARPDPVGLARRLVDLELNAELDTYHRAAAAYAEVLGEEGIGEYRRLVEPRFEALAAGDDDGFSPERFRVTQAMVGVALASGDPDQLIAVKQRSLRSPDDYREVASMLAETGRVAEAIDWAQRGLGAFASRPWQTPPLRELLARLHRQCGRTEDPVRVFWDGFASAPSLATYRRLIQEAEASGDAAAWRERALDHLRARLDRRTAAAGPSGTGAPGAASPGASSPPHRQAARHPGSSFAEILLYENEVDEAWQVASTHGCDQRLWLTLARARERSHPQDAIPIYQREAATLIGMKKASGYHQAVELMARVEKLYRALGRPEAFSAYVAEVRAEHRRKRNLMGLLDARRWRSG